MGVTSSPRASYAGLPTWSLFLLQYLRCMTGRVNLRRGAAIVTLLSREGDGVMTDTSDLFDVIVIGGGRSGDAGAGCVRGTPTSAIVEERVAGGKRKTMGVPSGALSRPVGLAGEVSGAPGLQLPAANDAAAVLAFRDKVVCPTTTTARVVNPIESLRRPWCGAGCVWPPRQAHHALVRRGATVHVGHSSDLGAAVEAPGRRNFRDDGGEGILAAPRTSDDGVKEGELLSVTAAASQSADREKPQERAVLTVVRVLALAQKLPDQYRALVPQTAVRMSAAG
jgi:hypothetical protein